MQLETLMRPIEPPAGGYAALQQRLRQQQQCGEVQCGVAKSSEVKSGEVNGAALLWQLGWLRTAPPLAACLGLVLLVCYGSAWQQQVYVLASAGTPVVLPLNDVSTSRDQLVRQPSANPQVKLYWKVTPQ